MGRGYLIAGDGVGQGGQKTAEEGCCSLEGNERSDRVEVKWVRGESERQKFGGMKRMAWS